MIRSDERVHDSRPCHHERPNPPHRIGRVTRKILRVSGIVLASLIVLTVLALGVLRAVLLRRSDCGGSPRRKATASSTQP